MGDYPPSLNEKAKRLEQLLLRLDAGETFETVCAELGLSIKVEDLPRLQEKYEDGGRNWQALFDARFGQPKKITLEMREWLYECKRQDETLTATELAKKMSKKYPVEVSAGHINYLLRQRGLTGRPGRPRKKAAPSEQSAPESEPALDNAGLFFPGGSSPGPGEQPDH